MVNTAEPSYPREFHTILLALREDGTPITIDKGTQAEAERYRLQFYNFLKWAKRAKNASATVHLAGRQYHVGLSVKGTKINFILKNGVRFRESENDVLAQLEAQGVDLSTVQVPDSHNNKAFMKHNPRHEVPPLMPEYDTPETRGPLATPSSAPVWVPTPGRVGFAKPSFVDEDTARLLALTKEVAERPAETELAETQWYPATLRTGTAAPHGPQDKLQYVMNKLIFDCEPAFLPYPTARGDSHEVSSINTGKRQAEWHRFLIDIGWDSCVTLRPDDAHGQWIFTLTEEGEQRLRAQRIIPAVRMQAGTDLELKNQLRLQISELLKGL